MRRIAILAIGLLAALPAFSQKKGAPAAASAAAPAAAVGATGPMVPKGPHPKSREENAALNAMLTSQDPDEQIKITTDLLDKFPDTDYKAQVLFFQARAYHNKKDDSNAIVSAERSLEADPKNTGTLLLLAEIYSRTTRSTDLNMDERLTKSDKYANDAIALLATAEKPKPDMPDADWASFKQGENERAYMALGLSALLRKKYDEAKADFDKGMGLDAEPLDMLYIERAYTTAKRYDDALTWIDKAAANPNSNDRIKQIAASDKTRVEALKKKEN